MIRHGGLIARRVDGRWKGVLIEGPSGAGKSDLALRMLAAGFALAADDRVTLWASAGRLYGRAPDTLHGLIEMRGLAVVRVAALPLAEVVVIARLGVPERLPEFACKEVLGVRIPVMDVAGFEATSPAKLSRAIETFAAAHKGRI